MAGKDKEGLVARGSKWGMKRMDGRFAVAADSLSAAGVATAGVEGLRTDSADAAVSARLRVMLRV
jgi:hypothetical protein